MNSKGKGEKSSFLFHLHDRKMSLMDSNFIARVHSFLNVHY